MRYLLEIAYKGTAYHGWQVQKNAHSVQQELNSCLARLFRKEIETVASGRTDTGVHAEQQFVHLDLDAPLTDHHVFKLNCILPKDIVIKSFRRIKDDVSARFDAHSRSYDYKICRIKDPFLQDFTYFFPRHLDINKMNEAAHALMKYNDFQSFSKVNTNVDHFLCNMYEAEWKDHGNLLIFSIEANRFLRGMVRTIVGSMIDVGQNRISVKEFEEIIQKKDRKAAGTIVPAQGLYLTRIKYPEEIFV